ncbi:hypothetical protein C1646_667170 [Rhizophagus diaphanus]|nr:hypothetical protein C1646_667170 [Rhizophagus diaphanus] [Rhizophagus sp. MUCL 43196]
MTKSSNIFIMDIMDIVFFLSSSNPLNRPNINTGSNPVMFEAGCLGPTQEQSEYFVRSELISWVARIDARPATQKGLNVPLFLIKLKNFKSEKLEEFAKFYMLSIDHAIYIDHAINILFL